MDIGESREGQGSVDVGFGGRGRAGSETRASRSGSNAGTPSSPAGLSRFPSTANVDIATPPPADLPVMKFVDLRATYDLELVQRFYDDIIMANFPIEDERDDLEWFQNGLMHANPDYLDPKDPLLYVVIAMAPAPRNPDERYRFENCGAKQVDRSWLIAGAIAFEYFKKSNCGLVTYIVTQPLFNRKGIARRLMELANEKLNQVKM